MKKTLSLILVLLLVLTSLAAFASDYENGVTVEYTGINQTDYGAYVVDASGSEKKTSSANVQVKDDTSYMIYQIPVPELDANQVFDSFLFRFASFYGSATSHQAYVRLYKLPEEVLDLENLTASDISQYTSDYATYAAGELLEHTPVSETSTKNYYNVFDITDYANECKNQQVIYVAATIKTITASVWVGGNDTYRAKYSFTPKAAPELSLLSSTPETGSVIMPSETVEFEYSNPIASYEAVLNGESAEMTVDSGKLTLVSELSQLENYTLDLLVTDIYSGTNTQSLIFSTGKEAFDSVATVEKSLFISSALPENIPQAGKEVHDGSSYAYFRITLPEITPENLLEKFSLKFHSYAGSTRVDPIRLYKLGTGWDEEALTTSDEAFAAIVSDYASNKISGSAAYVGPGQGAKEEIFELDLTGYALECLENGDTEMCIALSSTATLQVFGNWTYNATSYRKPVASANILTKPEIKVYGSSVRLVGRNLKSASFKLLTDIEAANQYAGLIDLSTGSRTETEFVYDSNLRTVSLYAPVQLSEKTTYRIVFEGEVTDVYGNSANCNIIVSEFTTGEDIVVTQPKIAAADAVVEDYEETVSAATVASGSDYKYVTEFTNNTDDVYEFIAAIGVFNSANELIGLLYETAAAPMGTNIVESSIMTVDSDASYIKAFVWDKNNRPLEASAYAKAE